MTIREAFLSEISSSVEEKTTFKLTCGVSFPSLEFFEHSMRSATLSDLSIYPKTRETINFDSSMPVVQLFFGEENVVVTIDFEKMRANIMVNQATPLPEHLELKDQIFPALMQKHFPLHEFNLKYGI